MATFKDKGISLRLKSNSAADTAAYGKIFAGVLARGEAVILEGALGGGKTTFVKGILGGLGYKKRVLSPSFTLIRQYNLKDLSVYHLDLYRLNSGDIFGLGIDDFLYSDRAITLIEWGNKMKGELDKYIKVEFVFLAENVRQLKFSSWGWAKGRLDSIKAAYTV